jgi:hypothetical protein
MHCDEAMLPGPSERYEPVLESVVDKDMDPNPCEEDEFFFHGMNPQVYRVVCTIIYRSVHVHTSTYLYILICTSMY